MRKLSLVLALLFSLAVILPVSLPGNHAPNWLLNEPLAKKSTYSSKKTNTKPKTVSVKSYKKKDGTTVKAHKRSAPSK